ncbi:NAD(P)/FAD-dependent oxidoreductase [Aliidiomarina indica]|uniref:NAD(P)/FAD-dependent oxidoreductase n=1 Tax=Aliidiomarina indica TaxID=2749147 RepID=UPI00188E110A|nr:FAD-dependent oxidoreductase [Aliidiomarina indica]
MYDPLIANTIPRDHEQGIDTYWTSHTQLPECRVSKLPEHAEFVVIGAGYTGLNAALALAQQGREVVLLDAGGIGAGCSSRNAGFMLPGSGRLSFSDYHKAFGFETAAGVQQEFASSIAHVEELVQSSQFPCDLISSRYLRLAHNQKMAKQLENQQALYEHTALDAEWFSNAEIARQIPGISWNYGGLQVTPARAVNPRALVGVYLDQVIRAGVRCIPHHPVIDWQRCGDGHRLATPAASIKAQHVLVCTNGYLAKAPFPDISARHMPVLSSILVTRPLTQHEQAAQGLRVNDMMMDTRTLKYYYRLLPDGRLLFGGRGAVTGANAADQRHQQRLEAALKATFPGLQNLATDYYWSGWISVALDAMPRVFSPTPGVYTSMGYCGAGVAFASLAGKRLAQLAMGETLPPLPFYQSPLPRFPLPRLRRMALRAFYALQRG